METTLSRGKKQKNNESNCVKVNSRGTRPDTRLSVADGWAGAEMRDLPLFDSMVTD